MPNPTCCPVCDFNLLTTDRGLFCWPCQQLVQTHAERKAVPLRVANTDGSQEHYENEEDLVEAIRGELTARGWTVLRIGQHIAKGSGTDAGTPDMACCFPPYPPYTEPKIVLLEAKFGRNRLTAAQQALVDAGISNEVRSVFDALAVCGEKPTRESDNSPA